MAIRVVKKEFYKYLWFGFDPKEICMGKEATYSQGQTNEAHQCTLTLNARVLALLAQYMLGSMRWGIGWDDVYVL